jgi:hypothetical protein
MRICLLESLLARITGAATALGAPAATVDITIHHVAIATIAFPGTLRHATTGARFFRHDRVLRHFSRVAVSRVPGVPW